MPYIHKHTVSEFLRILCINYSNSVYSLSTIHLSLSHSKMPRKKKFRGPTHKKESPALPIYMASLVTSNTLKTPVCLHIFSNSNLIFLLAFQSASNPSLLQVLFLVLCLQLDGHSTFSSCRCRQLRRLLSSSVIGNGPCCWPKAPLPVNKIYAWL